MVKMYQNSFGGRAPAGPSRRDAPQTPSANRRPLRTRPLVEAEPPLFPQVCNATDYSRKLRVKQTKQSLINADDTTENLADGI